MRLPDGVRNPGLATLLRGSGIATLAAFAEAVNAAGRRRFGLALTYDHTSVKRWLRGGACQHPDLVAEVLSHAWGLPVPREAVWPAARGGAPPVAPTLAPWSAARTMAELNQFARTDLLTDRLDLLNESFPITTGDALIGPIRRWLATGPADGLGAATELGPTPEPTPDQGRGAVGMREVEMIELATEALRAAGSACGARLVRDAAVGQLKHVTRLSRGGQHDQAVSRHLLAAVADLAALVARMSCDLVLHGPAQRYYLYALHAAREAGDDLLTASLLTSMATQLRALGRPADGLRLVELAFYVAGSRMPVAVHAMLLGEKARNLACLGEVEPARRALGMAEGLAGEADWDEPVPRRAYRDKAEFLAGLAECRRTLAERTDEPTPEAADVERPCLVVGGHGRRSRQTSGAQGRTSRLSMSRRTRPARPALRAGVSQTRPVRRLLDASVGLR